jgi:hypothetical protein
VVEKEIGGGQTLAISDLPAFFSAPSLQRRLGSLRVESTLPLLGWGRLYNVSSSGTFGQFVALRDSTPGTHSRDVYELSRVVRNALDPSAREMFPVGDTDEVRSNLTVLDVGGRAGVVRLKVFDSAGNILAVDDRYIAPYETLFVGRYLESIGLSSRWPLRIEMEPVTEDANVHAFVSVVQQKTNDAVTVPAE